MGECILMPTNVGVETQNALAGLGKWGLVRDDSQTEFPHRVYRDERKNVYSSVTHILQETSTQEQKDALARWAARPSSSMERDLAAKRGNLAHSHAEYILKTAAKLTRQVGNKREVWSTGGDGLERCPPKVCSWGIQKAISNAPRVSWSASGYARGLRTFIEASIAGIHAVEFSVHYLPKGAKHGFAGTADCLVDVFRPGPGGSTYPDGPFIVDWKTSVNARSEELLRNYKDQLGAYSLGLTENTGGLRAKGAIIVVARRSGHPQVKFMDQMQLWDAEARFSQRFERYLDSMKKPLDLAAG